MSDPLARAQHILRSKGPQAHDYWRMRGRDRFRRELTRDGLNTEQVDAALAQLESELSARLLDDVLASVRAGTYNR